MKVKVLGTNYEIISVEETNDNLEKYPLLKDSSGYTDITTKQIFILKYKTTEETFYNLNELYKKTLRHELVHAFLYESGLFNNSNGDWAKNEEVIDWIAIQFEKLLISFIETKAINTIGIDKGNDKSMCAMASIKIPEIAPLKVPDLKQFNLDIVNEIGKSITESMTQFKDNVLKASSFKGGSG